jgi:hypothetical protein
MTFACAATVPAEEPAYLKLTAGQSVEIEGDWHEDDSVFVATDIELLPLPRRPKLRGVIFDADSSSQRLMMFGRWIDITEKTQFVNVDEVTPSFSKLRPGERVEISCKVDSTGRWLARHIRIGSVKESSKIKGNIGAVHFDGKDPESIDIEGITVRVNAKTVIYKTLGAVPDAEAEEEE